MPVLFGGNPGRVVRVDAPTAPCRTRIYDFANPGDRIFLEDWASIVTRVQVSQQSNVQFLHTLGRQVFIYAFGDRVGQMVFSGLSFACPCPELTNASNGLEQIYLWYRNRRVARRPAPVRIMLGGSAFDAFAIGMGGDVLDASTGLMQWNLTLSVLPEDFS